MVRAPATEVADPVTHPAPVVGAPAAESPAAESNPGIGAPAVESNPGVPGSATDDAAVPEDEIPKDAMEAPSWVTSNQLYSNAYKKVKYQGGDAEAAKSAGKKATSLFRDHGLISPALTGVPRERKPKAPKEAVNQDGENAHK